MSSQPPSLSDADRDEQEAIDSEDNERDVSTDPPEDYGKQFFKGISAFLIVSSKLA